MTAGFAANDLQQQRSRALHCLARQLRIHTTLEAVRRVGVQAIGAGLAGNGDAVEEGAFQEQIAGIVAHTAVLTAHHAGDGQRAAMISDDQSIGTQADFLAVEQHQLLALFSHPHANAAIDFGEVEGVHRLAELEHHVVGDVHRCIDAANIGTTQALDHPQRGRARQVNVTYNATEVTRARLGRKHLDWAYFVMCRSNDVDSDR